ncbi:MAG: thioredoxin TrxC [Gallionellaceae bacterium]|jgi:thioredoxin 2
MIHIICPHCDATNRLPKEKLHESGNCGKCHQPLFSGHPLELNEARFDKYFAQSEIPLVVDFWAPWCGPCRMMAPAFSEAARQLEPNYRLVKVNTEEAQNLGARFNIRSIPTLAIFHKGHEIARQSGAMDTGGIVRWVKSNS